MCQNLKTLRTFNFNQAQCLVSWTALEGTRMRHLQLSVHCKLLLCHDPFKLRDNAIEHRGFI